MDRESQTNTAHLYDIWRVVRSIVKKLLKVSKEKELIKEWIKEFRIICTAVRPVYPGIPENGHSQVAVFYETCRKHKDHPDSLFKECAHDDDIAPRKWMKIGEYIF